LVPRSAQKRTPAFDEKRLHLLDAAARVFAAAGHDRASMRRIAAEAGVSLAGIYHYVAGKEELLYWIQLHTFDSLLRGLEEALVGVSEPRARLAAAVRNHVCHFGEHMDALKVCARELETLAGEEYARVHERRRAYFEAIHALVRKLSLAGEEPRLDPWVATANLFGMLNWLYQWYDGERRALTLERLAEQQTTLFLDGYGSSKDAASSSDDRRNE
jgi:AcrR family transcriptional regulator